MTEVATLTAEVIRHLQALVRLDTSNPPGSESLVASYLAEVLRREGLEPLLLEKTPGRANLVARLQGRGLAPPLLLMGHTDVVPAEPAAWRHPPFEGVIDDGYLWGRGALDMKSMLAYELVVLLHLKRTSTELARDVIFAATADEEGFGADRCGMGFLSKECPELVRAEFALNEFGGFTTWIGKLPVYPIIVAEKGACRLIVRATGPAGYSSRLIPDSAIARLCVALERLNRQGLPVHRSAVVQDAIDRITKALTPRRLNPVAKKLGRALFPCIGPALLNHRFPMAWQALYEVTHNTAVPTLLQAGTKFNVIPGQAEAILSGRYLPGTDIEEFVSEVRMALGEGVSLELTGYSRPLAFPYKTPLFDAICTTVEALHPGSVAVPWLMSSGTDAGHVAALGATVYGFSPLQCQPDFDPRGLIHGVDERIPLNGIAFGVVALLEVVERVACVE